MYTEKRARDKRKYNVLKEEKPMTIYYCQRNCCYVPLRYIVEVDP